MRTTRRRVIWGLGALALAACSGGASRAPGPAPGPGAASFRAVPDPAFDAWLAAYRGRAEARGIAPAVLDRALPGARFIPEVIERDRNQTEFTRTLEDYLAIVASQERVAEGRRMLRRHAPLLAAIEARYGVAPQVVAAVWGVESRFGQRRGTVPVLSATATLAHDGRRGAFFERQLTEALRILQAGDVTPDRLTGSWAGAMGHTQFIPTSYAALAVDFDGDGRRDVWSDDPTDALASAANYLARSGWRRGAPWGIEVTLPPGFDASLSGRTRRRGVDFWSVRGVRRADGGALPDHGPAALLLPQGPAAPAFLAFANFEALARYNDAVNYVIGVGHLSDRLAGGPPLHGAFPPDAAGLSRPERQEIQRRLAAAGFDAGPADGVIGPDTEAAISAWQRARGQTADGTATRALLAALR